MKKTDEENRCRLMQRTKGVNMKIAITAESTIDLPKSLLEQYQITTVPFSILLGEETYLDGTITPQDIFDFVDKTGRLPKTSAVNQFTYEEFFKAKLAEGYDAIVHFSLSSGISSTCQNATNASKTLPNVYVIDTRSLSTGIALLAIYASELVAQGLDAKEIYERCVKRVPNVQASFSLESVNYLHKGGRCSTLAMLGANLLHIKPEIIVDPSNGCMHAGNKYRGPMKKAVMGYVEDILKTYHTPDKSRVFITYSSAPEDVVQCVRERLQQEGFQQILETKAGGTISSYCGPHCLGILYINDGK